jgi:ubiquinol-cytochrome c reductase cytochrome c subunit
VPDEQLARGALIYQQQCAQCHGGDGRGGLVQGTDRRAPPVRDLELGYVDLVLRTGRMPPVGDPFDNRLRKPTVTGEEREALVTWIDAEFGLTGGIPEARPGDPAKGLQVYSVHCAHCHGSSGAGGVAGAGAFTPSLTGYEPVVIAEAIRVGPFEMPQFSREQVTDEEVNHIVGFLQQVEEEESTPIFGLVEINPVYASGFVALLALVMVFSLFWIGGTPAWFPDPRPEPRDKPRNLPPHQPRTQDHEE